MQPPAGKRNPPQLDAALRSLAIYVDEGEAEALAERLGVDAATIGRWVKGTITPKGERRARLLKWHAGLHHGGHTPSATYDAGFWRGVVEMAEGSARDLADRLRRTLDNAPPRSGWATPADSSAALPPPLEHPKAAQG
jgi:transcriptional regulator with XRE-family HTH domain